MSTSLQEQEKASLHNESWSFKRQRGSEKDTTPLPHLHDTPSDFAITYSRIAIALTILFWFLYLTSVVFRLIIDVHQNYNFLMQEIGYTLMMFFLTLSALVYLITRQGALQRFKKHIRTPQRVIDEHFAKQQPSITVLVPSYNEEVSVVRKTLLSAALQEFPNIRIVLLLDDDPSAIKHEDQERLERTYALGEEIKQLFSVPQSRAQTLCDALIATPLEDRQKFGGRIASEYEWAAQWLEETAMQEVVEDHVDVFYVEEVLRGLAHELRNESKQIDIARKQGEILSSDRLVQLAHRLLWIFRFEFEYFERKRYQSLSQEKNKAMNLNAYIGLMGGMYRKVKTDEGNMVLLETSDTQAADLVVKDSDYILTLDADSILLREYCSRLVYFLEQADNRDVAVVQTPYSSFRGAPSRLERLAGATTDMQHIIHQGMSQYNATFWVGANAVIRKKALEDIVESEFIGGFEVKRYIRDNTVIEDTESSIDLAVHSWRLVNYPERLSYSATPPDFGSLAVQRQRWANGGLLIFLKLLRLGHARKHAGKPLPFLEFLVRMNYMLSIAWSSIALIFILAYPYDGRLLSPLVLLAALPYFIAMAMDLKYNRYRYSDIFLIYGFNLILLPVNIAGTLKSIEQAITTKKIPFARTPKVKNRTATSWPYLVAPLFIVGFSLFTLWRNIQGENWSNAAFAGFNALLASWAIVAYIGIGNLIADLFAAYTNWLFVEVPVSENEFVRRRTWRLPGFSREKKFSTETN